MNSEKAIAQALAEVLAKNPEIMKQLAKEICQPEEKYRDMGLSPREWSALASLNAEQRVAVRKALKAWVTLAMEWGYMPMAEWGNFQMEVEHSALLTRLLSGKKPFTKKPPLKHAYPDYSALE